MSESFRKDGAYPPDTPSPDTDPDHDVQNSKPHSWIFERIKGEVERDKPIVDEGCEPGQKEETDQAGECRPGQGDEPGKERDENENKPHDDEGRSEYGYDTVREVQPPF